MKFVSLAATLLLSIIANTVSAKQFELNGIFYETLSASPNEVRVTYDPKKITKDEFGQYIGVSYTGRVVVPAEVTYSAVTYNVTEIGEYAFSGNPELTEVVLPNTIANIGWGAFYLNESLETMVLPSSVRNIAGYAFRNCYNLRQINFPEGLETIGADAFTHDYALEEIYLPASVRKIESYAFCACTGLKKITLADSDIPLEKTSLYTVSQIFDQVKADYAYIGRIGAEGFVKVNTKELVLGKVFDYVTSGMFVPETLEKIIIPSSVTGIVRGAFADAVALKDVILEDGTKTIYIECASSSATASVATYISCFQNCPLETLYVGRTFNDLEYIASSSGARAFSYSKTLKNVTFGRFVTKLPPYAFIRCEGLENIDFSNSRISEIGDACFSDDCSLTGIELPASLKKLNYRAFDSCTGLKSVVFGDAVTYIGELAFSGCGIEEITLPASVEEISYSAFAYNRNLKKLMLGDGLKLIDRMVFAGCESLEELVIPASVTLIGENAFSSLKSLRRIKFEDSREENLRTEYSGTSAKPLFTGSAAMLEEIYIGKAFGDNSDYRNIFGTSAIYSSPEIIYGPLAYRTNTGMFKQFMDIKKVKCLGTSVIPSYYDSFYMKGRIDVCVPEGYAGTYEMYGWDGFRSLDDSAVETTYEDSMDINVSGNSISVIGNSADVRCYDTDGRELYPEKTVDATVVFSIPRPGIYIVRVNDCIRKIIIK